MASSTGDSLATVLLVASFLGEVNWTEPASIARSPEATIGRSSAKPCKGPEAANNNAKSAARFAHRVLLMLSRYHPSTEIGLIPPTDGPTWDIGMIATKVHVIHTRETNPI